jgi:hypothetical protein
MLQPLISRLSPATVISTIALFVALGGGYAMAFSGSGSLQKAAKGGGISTTQFETIRTITGIGSLQAKCNEFTGSLLVRVRNTSGEPLRSYMDVIGSDGPNGTGHFPSAMANNSFDLEGGHQMGSVDTFRYHIWPDDGSKSPQADMTVSSVRHGLCPISGLAVLVLNTQQ